ncbi:MAG: PEP-utilizing enzyme [Patescibacteria group bacterium]
MSQPVITSNQPSITEWLAAIGEVEESNAFRVEDNKKAERLEMLFQAIGLPYERPEELPARELADLTGRFKEILETRGDELCAIRLVPNKPELPKLRQRGVSIRDCYENWFKKQAINPDDYSAFICPHSETLLWSATFVVTDEAIYGEIIRGLHSQLTHGVTTDELLQFAWDFDSWSWSKSDPEAEKEIRRIISMLRVDEPAVQRSLGESLGADFSHGYLKGYFEATIWPDGKAYIIDYNRLLSKYLPEKISLSGQSDEAIDSITGAVAHPGIAHGRVRIVSDISSVQDFSLGDILVCDNTDVRFLPLMQKAAAIVTNRGGILTHAAIVARELGKPCIIGTKVATEFLKDGDEVEVDAEKGILKITKRA